MALRGWLCPESWHRHVHEAVALAKWYVDEKPEAVASVALVCSLVAIAACACCLLHRRRMQVQLKRLNSELAAVRENLETDKIKKSARGGEGTSLVEAIMDEESGRCTGGGGEMSPSQRSPASVVAGAGGKARLAPAGDAAAAEQAGERLGPVEELARIRAKYAKQKAEATPSMPPRQDQPPTHPESELTAAAEQGSDPSLPLPSLASSLSPDVKAAASFYSQFAIHTAAADEGDPATISANADANAAAPLPTSAPPGSGAADTPAAAPRADPAVASSAAPIEADASSVDERSHVVRALQALESKKRPMPPARRRPSGRGGGGP